MLALIFYSGLHFKDASITNEVSWIDAQNGIRFGNNGIAFAKATPPTDRDLVFNTGDLSIGLGVKPGDTSDRHFKLLLLLHGGDDRDQLVIGQWRSWLVVMNGDDYAAKRGIARVSVNAFQNDQERFIYITSGQGGTAIYIDGQLVKRKTDLTLKRPDGVHLAQLVLGNSIYGRHPWSGELYGLVYYDLVRAETTIRGQYEQWRRDRSFAFAKNDNATGLYLFDERKGDRALDQSPGKRYLVIPEKMTILTKEFLGWPLTDQAYYETHFQDMIINLIGFIPMGFLLAALFWQIDYRRFRKQLLLVLLICGAVSLTIELAQAWIPSRSSQMLDLILNTLGGGIGVLLFNALRNWFDRTSTGSPPASP